jgi:hypothetical protein
VVSQQALNFYAGNALKMSISSLGVATFSGTTSANVVISRDNLFVGTGQLYIGAENSSTNNSFRQEVSLANGTFKIQSRESGIWTDAMTIDNALDVTFSGNLAINNTLSSSGSLIETAGLNVYLRPATGSKVYIDSGNGLSVTGAVYIGSSCTWNKGVANGNLVTNFTLNDSSGIYAPFVAECLVATTGNSAPRGSASYIIQGYYINGNAYVEVVQSQSQQNSGVSISAVGSGLVITITATIASGASRTTGIFKATSFNGISSVA